jgi:hypothetical protein
MSEYYTVIPKESLQKSYITTYETLSDIASKMPCHACFANLGRDYYTTPAKLANSLYYLFIGVPEIFKLIDFVNEKSTVTVEILRQENKKVKSWWSNGDTSTVSLLLKVDTDLKEEVKVRWFHLYNALVILRIASDYERYFTPTKVMDIVTGLTKYTYGTVAKINNYAWDHANSNHLFWTPMTAQHVKLLFDKEIYLYSDITPPTRPYQRQIADIMYRTGAIKTPVPNTRW